MPMPNNSRSHRLFLQLLQKLRDVGHVCGAHIDGHFPRQRFFTRSAAVFVLDGVDLALVVGDPLGIVHKLGAVHSEHAHMHCWGENPVVTAKLQLNGQDRFSEREGTYFDQVQPWQHHSRAPDTGVNVYSFALRPEEHQPSGTCNMSRIDNATLQLVLSNATVEGVNTAKVRVYARNYNVLRIMSGMGGLAYSN